MLYRTLLRLFLLLNVFAAVSLPQAKPEGPVTLSELRRVLTAAEESEELIDPTNRELIAAVEERGVDFVLTPEEEWALQMREASDELIEAIRSAVDPAEREYRLLVKRQRGLYETFARNFTAPDLTSKSAALNAGRAFLTEFADDANVAQIVAYMRRQIPSLERSVQMLERREEMIEQNRIRSLYRNSMRDDSRRGRRTTPAQTGNAPAQTTARPAPATGAPQTPAPAQKPL